jgi:FAD:protein FMN transferase
MGMPVTVCVRDEGSGEQDVSAVASWFENVNQRFSTYLETSEVYRLNAGAIVRDDVSRQLEDVLLLCEQTNVETGGYFDAERDGRIDPSGLVKGWAIEKASALLSARGFTNHFIEVGGDIQAMGHNSYGQPWRVGIRNPFQRDQLVKVLEVSGRGVATSGTAIRGQHIYNPLQPEHHLTEIVSLTVIGPSIYEADRLATAAFAMGRDGLSFIAERPNLEGYAIAADGMAEYTPGFNHYVR